MGPLSGADVKSMALAGQIAPEDRLATSPDGPWRAASKVGNLTFGSPASAAPAASLPAVTGRGGDDADESSFDARPIDVSARPVVAPATTGTAPGVVVMRREAISPSDAVQFAIDRFRANPVFYVLSSLLIVLALNVPGIGFWFVGAPIIIGFYQCVRNEVVTGQRASFGQVFKGFGQFLPALIIGLWGSLLVLLGLLCCCVPGLVLLPVPFLAFIVAGRERAGGLKALTRALRVVEKDPFGLLAACVLLYLIGISGYVLCYVGALVTFPIMLLGMYRVADQMLSTEDA